MKKIIINTLIALFFAVSAFSMETESTGSTEQGHATQIGCYQEIVKDKRPFYKRLFVPLRFSEGYVNLGDISIEKMEKQGTSLEDYTGRYNHASLVVHAWLEKQQAVDDALMQLDCPVCFECVGDVGTNKKLKCGHVYHQACFDELCTKTPISSCLRCFEHFRENKVDAQNSDFCTYVLVVGGVVLYASCVMYFGLDNSLLWRII